MSKLSTAFGAGKGLELRGRSPSRPKPHPSPDDALSGADYVRAYFTLRLRRMKFQRKAKLQIPRRNSTLKAPVLLQNLGEGIDEMSEFRIVRAGV